MVAVNFTLSFFTFFKRQFIYQSLKKNGAKFTCLKQMCFFVFLLFPPMLARSTSAFKLVSNILTSVLLLNYKPQYVTLVFKISALETALKHVYYLG